MSYLYSAYLDINDTDGRSRNFSASPTVTVWDGRTADEIESPSPTLTNITTGLYAVEITLDDITDVLFKIVPDEDDEDTIADIKVIHEGYIETVETMGVGVKLDPVQGKVTWDQQKIVANVALEGALDISNSNSTGYGQLNYGGRYGLVNTGELLAGQKNQGTMKDVDGFDPALALEATLTAIKGAGWTNETLVTLMEAIEAISGGGGGGNTPEQIRAAVGLALANLDAQLLGIHNKTTNLPASPAAVGSAMTLTSAYDKAKDDVLTPLATVDNIVDAIKAKTDNLPASPAATGAAMTLTSAYDAAKTAATQASVNAIPTSPLLAANYTAPDNASIAAIKAKTDNLPTSPAPANEYDARMTAIQADLDNPAQYKADVSSLAKATDLQDVENKIDAVDAKVSAIDTDTVMSFMIDGFTFEQIVQIMASVLAGKLTRSGDTLTFRDLADKVNRVVAETDANKQRTDMTYTV